MSSTYVITGASRGLGLEFVKQVAVKGHTVFALARNPEASEGLQSPVDNKKVFAVKHDAKSAESAKEAAKEVEKYDPDGVDVLINNAGINRTPDTDYSLKDTPKEEYLKIFETNVIGVSSVTQTFLPLLRKRNQGSVKKMINISSIVGSIAIIGGINPTAIFSAYCVSKAALNMLTKLNATVLAKEKIYSTSIHPGLVRTNMGGENAPVLPEESIAGILKVIDNLTPEQNGAFLDFKGKELAS